jgi:hypothetical protein
MSKDDFEAVRYIGEAIVYLNLDDDDSYSGMIEAPNLGSSEGEMSVWEFDTINPSPHDKRTKALDSDEMFDKIAAAAASFGAQYTSKRTDTGRPDWAPDPETADDIDTAVSSATLPDGSYEVRRTKRRGWQPNPVSARAALRAAQGKVDPMAPPPSRPGLRVGSRAHATALRQQLEEADLLEEAALEGIVLPRNLKRPDKGSPAQVDAYHRKIEAERAASRRRRK